MYCSTECQRIDWKKHKKDCNETAKALAQVESEGSSPASKSSTDPEIFYQLGISRVTSNPPDIQGAIQAYGRCLTLKNEHFMARNNLGTAYRSIGS